MRSTTTRPWIFITGLPRSGTTWASKAITAAIRGRLIHEPFNWKRHPDRVEFHMKYLPAGSDASGFLAIMRHSMRADFPLVNLFMSSNYLVVKDVHACFAIDYLWEQLHPRIIILVRHPCAVADSWARLGLQVDFRLDLLLAQQMLVTEHLQPFVRHIRRRERDFYFMMGAYWGATYYVLQHLAARDDRNWTWITHESLCNQPFATFIQLTENLGCTVNMRGKKALRRFLGNHNRKKGAHEGPHSVARVTEKEPNKWEHRLTDAQITNVLEGTKPFEVLNQFYGT